MLTGKEEEAEKAFEKQTEIVKHVTATKKTDKTVAFFYITSNGLVQVRQTKRSSKNQSSQHSWHTNIPQNPGIFNCFSLNGCHNIENWN